MSDSSPSPYPVSALFPMLLALYEMALYLSNDAYLPALPIISNELASSHQLVQLTLTTWFMGSASMQLFLGPICDKIGRRQVLLSGGLIFVLTAIACACTTSVHAMLVLRFIQGASIASMAVAGYTTVHELYDREQAIHTFAIMNSITVLAPSFGPLVGAIVLTFGDWRLIFSLLAIWAGLCIIGLYFKMPETMTARREKVQLNTMIKHYKSVITNKAFLLFNLCSQLLFAAMIAWIAAGPFLLVDSFHLETLDFGLIQVVIFGSFIVCTRLVKRLMTSVTLANIIRLGIGLSVFGGTCALIASSLWPNTLWPTIVAMMFLAGGSGFAFPVLNRLAIDASDAPMGARVAMSSFLMTASGMVASGIISTVYNGSLLSLAIILFCFSVLATITHHYNKAPTEHPVN